MARFDWRRHKHARRDQEPATPPPSSKKGCWSHIKREPCRTYSKEEIAAWERGREGGPR